MVKLLKYCLVVIFLVITGMLRESVAQDTPTAYLEGRITSSSGKKLTGATITVERNGSTFKTVTIGSNGKYKDLELPMGFEYTVTVSCDEYLSKTILIDSKTGYYEEDSPLQVPMDIPFQLDEKKPDVDYSPVSNGFKIGKLAIDPNTGGLAIDQGFTSSQGNKYKQFFDKLEKEANKEEEQFKKFIEDGDKAFESGNYSQAMTNYQKAKEIKENDPGVNGKITTTEQKIEQKKNFDEAVSSGDDALSAKNYDQAIAKYEQAKTIMPDDKTIDDKIKNAQDQKAAAESAEVDAKYQSKMDEANAAFTDKDYAYAKTLYQQAGEIKPDEKEPPAKVKECEDIIKEQLAKEQEFNELVAAGDKGMLDEDFDTAIEKYTAALEIKKDSRVESELAKAKDLKKKKEEAEANAAKQAEFDGYIADGDGKLGSEDFEGAIAQYQKALDMDFDNATANAKIAEAEAAKQAKEEEAAAAAKQEQFDQLIADGDGKLGSEDFDGAIAKYTEALDLGVDNATANAKIAEAEAAKQAKEEEAAAAAKQEQFDQLISDGDGKLGSEDFDGAIAKYTEALDLGVDNATANAKIAEAEAAKQAKEEEAAAAAKQEQFDQLISDGDGKLGSEDFDGAIAKYTEALDIGVDNATANAKIAEAEAAKKAKEEEAAEAAKQEQFDQLISDGDGKLGSEDFDGAIAKYTEALDLGVDNATANAKIAEAEVAKQAKEEEAEAAAKQEQFDQLIADGDGKLSSEDFDAAIAKYKEALALNIDNSTAETKIAEAEEAKAAYEAELAAKNEAEQLQTKFDQFISNGDGKLGSKDFDGAITDYQSALDLGVNDPLAKQKIKEAEDAKVAYEEELAAQDEAAKQAEFDQFISSGDGHVSSNAFDMAIKDYESALATGYDNDLANQKIQEAKDAKAAYQEEMAAQDEAAKQEEFDKFISTGDGHLSSNTFDQAISSYESALDLGVNNTLANQKIQAAKEAKAAYEEQMAAQDEAAAREKEFNDLIAKGDAAKNAKSWDEAKDFYGQANEVKSESPIPQQKIDEVNELMKKETANQQDELFNKVLAKIEEFKSKGNYEPALGIIEKQKGNFPDKVDVLSELEQEITALKAKEDEYNKLMASADGLFEAGKWKEARADYVKAKLVFDRPRPSEQIAIIDQKLADEAAANDEAAELAKKKAEYEALMTKAKSQRESKQYQDAIATYKAAQQVLPNELEPQKRIDEINALLANMANENAILEKYQAAIAKADAKRDEAIAAESDELATQAKDLYNEANKIKSDETYPQEQVNNLSNLMKKWAEDVAKELYQKIIDKADQLFADKNWDGAEKLYTRAKDLNPVDPYPPAQLEKIKNARANEGKLDAYNQFVQEGNSLFQEEKYKKAITAYQNALGEKPSAKYPQDKIDEINGILSQMSQQAEKQRVEEEKSKVVIPDYGNEVSMSEEEIEKMWADARVDEVTDLDEDYDRYKEKVGDENADEMSFQTGRTEAINDNYEEMDQEIADLNQSWDEQRKDILPEMVDFKEGEKEKLNNFSNREAARTYDLDDYYNESETERSEYELSLDEDRERVISDMEKYKLDRSEINLDLAEIERDITYDNNEYYDEYEKEIQDDNAQFDERRKDNIVDMSDYKEDQIGINSKRIDQGVSSTYETHDSYREMADEYQDFSIDGDERRKEKTVAEMDEYKEVQSDITLSNQKKSIKKTDGVNEYNVEYHDYLDEFADEMDVPREDNVSAMEIYQNEMSDDFKGDVEMNEKRSQENYLDKDAVKEKQATLLEDESTMVENNMEKMEDYKDKTLDAQADLNKEFSDVGYDNSVTMDSIKAQKSTMFSDENVDPLANQYPEGITEKTYQRTNNLGEVIEVTIVRIVVRGNKADEYKKVTSKWNTAYFKNGGIINEYVWDTETN
ncbi:carboxypeptidase regulatory-like domain-containing protein [Parvicella tangerina]|uniref:Tetratricopeptide repeat protein n=1 Tax=Parvicella tangerina TaxID=2829795 RepID=A0A916JL82_9FLAO|nr:hypothetical protein [Parvicella tangerina]CAG5078838.1 hypothetical protein CRYO30217_00782 [Parvicella tangerina]